VACVLAIGGIAAAQPKGSGRLKGKIFDETGKPAQDATVHATLPGLPQPVQIRTNNKGEFELRDLPAGKWEVTFVKEGYAPVKQTIDLADRQRIENIEVKLAKSDPNEEIQKEYQRAVGLLQQKDAAGARKVFEDLLAKYPTLELQEPIARTYAAENNFPKAIEYLKMAIEKNPDSVTAKTLLGDLLIETGQKEEGRKTLESIDMTKAKDPFPFINMAIGMLNEQKAPEGLALMDKLVAQFPTVPEVYYYRGRANLANKKNVEAKADLEKFVSMAPPTQRELADAKKILEQLKDVK
jgi:predicted Zn-dependent protease